MYAPTRDQELTSTTTHIGLFQSIGFSRIQRPTPSATTWPSSLKGGLKIRIIKSQTQHSHENQHINGILLSDSWVMMSS